jgi:hypothetical protein
MAVLFPRTFVENRGRRANFGAAGGSESHSREWVSEPDRGDDR